MFWLLLAGSLAAARSPCRDLEPRDRLDSEARSIARTSLRVALSAAGIPDVPGVRGAVPPGLGELAQQDEEARSWLFYRICVLTVGGILPSETSKELTATVANGGVAPDMPDGPVMTLFQLAFRINLVNQLETLCSTPGSEESCEVNRKILADFDEGIREEYRRSVRL